MSWRRIRPVALGIPFRGDEILVARHTDETAGRTFYRPLGGGVEFGEESHDSVRREFREELDAGVTVETQLGIIENLFEFEGDQGHEVVFLYEVAFEDDRFYEQESFEAVEDSTGERFPVQWKPTADFDGNGDDILYPDDVPAVLDARQVDRSTPGHSGS